MKKTMASVLAAVMLLMLMTFAAPGFAKGSAELRNALEIDGLGNLSGASSLLLNGKPFGIGDRVEPGLLHNASDHPVVLAFSNDRLIKLNPGEAVEITADVATQECRCRCGSTIKTLPAANAAACTAHNGERCESPTGIFYDLSSCALTWVGVADPADPVEPAEPVGPGTSTQ